MKAWMEKFERSVFLENKKKDNYVENMDDVDEDEVTTIVTGNWNGGEMQGLAEKIKQEGIFRS